MQGRNSWFEQAKKERLLYLGERYGVFTDDDAVAKDILELMEN